MIFSIFAVMKIALLQMDLVWADADANRNAASEMIRSAAPADIYLLPEMFTTGFCTSPKGIAEKADTQTLEWMKQTAAQHDAAIAGSVAVESLGKFYNRFYFVLPDGTYYTYDKRHLFTFGGEHHNYTAGHKRVVIEYRGVRIMPLVCYDLRFPVWSRNKPQGDEHYDLLLYVASWPTPRIEPWNTLVRARAIENVCYVAAVNRVGTDPDCHYCGCSAIVDFKGETLAQRERESVGVIYAELDFKKLEEFRAKFPALGDGDKFDII